MTTVFIISAPSGSGKSTLVNRLMDTVSDLDFSVSFTTRALRGQEVDGEDYHFISRPEFESRIAAGEFLEHAEVFGNYYGTHASALTEAKAHRKDLILDIDVQGAEQLRSSIPDAVTIFILPPSKEVLEHRLRARGQDKTDVIQRRLNDAAHEIRDYNLYDYVIVNREIDHAALVLQSIVRAERARRQRVEETLVPILATFAATIEADLNVRKHGS